MHSAEYLEQLRQAYEQHHKKEWPSFEACLTHPIYSRILKIKVMLKHAVETDHIFDVVNAPSTLLEDQARSTKHGIFCVCPPCVKAFKEKQTHLDQKSLASNEKPE